MSTLRPWLVRGAAFLALVYALVVVGMFLGQRRLIYIRLPPVPLWGEVQVLPSGVPVIRSGPDPRLAWFHGNADQLGTLEPVARGLDRPTLFVEYPGYGESPGSPTEASLLAVAREALATLAQPPTCVGHSLGTGVAVAMAAEGRCRRLVLIAPYTSIADAAQARYPWLPAWWLVLDRWDSRARAGGVRVPTLVLHGEHDRVVPTGMGREMAATIPGATYVELAGRGHNDVYGPELWGRIRAFADGG